MAGVEQDENGNLSFDPAKFALGFLGGAGGSKAAQRIFNHKVPRAYALKSVQNLQDSYKALSQKNPMLFAKIMQNFEPRDFLKSKKDMDSLSKKVFNKELGQTIEATINNGNVSIMQKAQFKNIDEFAALFDSIDKNKGKISTPMGEVQVNVKYAYRHFTKNTHNKDRESIKGGFFETFRNPLFIVEQTREGANKPSVYFYKPFYDENKKLLNLFGIGLRGNGIEFKTYYLDDRGNRLRQILNNEVKILYVKD